MEKKSKYDTNPLDPDYERGTDDVWGSVRSTSSTSAAQQTGEAARGTEGHERVSTEAPTRYFEENRPYTSYPSVFIPPAYQPPMNQGAEMPRVEASFQQAPPNPKRTVAGIGLPENLCKALPYIPFSIGIVPAVIELFLVPRKEVNVRFNAAQALALQLAIMFIGFLFRMLSIFTGSGFGGFLFRCAAFVFLIYSMFRVWKGHQHRLAPLDDATRWLNEKIEPKKF